MVPTLVLGLVTAAVWRRLETKPSEPVATA
jgi:hypothetical protein